MTLITPVCLGVLEEPVSHIVATQTHTVVKTEPKWSDYLTSIM